MSDNESLKEITSIILAALILTLVVSFSNRDLMLVSLISFLIILGSNTLIKKIVGHRLEIRTRVSFWKMYQFGLRKDNHFKFPLPMAWLPLVIALFTKGALWIFPILEFDVEAKTERVSRRHGLYRFSQVTEWHMAWIATWGIIINLLMGVIAYSLDYELFAKLSIYYAAWSIIPFSSLDGTKILFGSRVLWIIMAVIVIMLLFLGFSIQI